MGVKRNRIDQLRGGEGSPCCGVFSRTNSSSCVASQVKVRRVPPPGKSRCWLGNVIAPGRTPVGPSIMGSVKSGLPRFQVSPPSTDQASSIRYDIFTWFRRSYMLY